MDAYLCRKRGLSIQQVRKRCVCRLRASQGIYRHVDAAFSTLLEPGECRALFDWASYWRVLDLRWVGRWVWRGMLDSMLVSPGLRELYERQWQAICYEVMVRHYIYINCDDGQATRRVPVVERHKADHPRPRLMEFPGYAERRRFGSRKMRMRRDDA